MKKILLTGATGYIGKRLLPGLLEQGYFDIGCPDILSYKDILLQYARIRRLRRWIFIVPVMTPKLSTYWLYFVTSTSYKLATSLVDSMKVEVVARDNRINAITGITPMTYEEALRETLI